MNLVDITLEETQEDLEFTEIGDELANFTADLVSLSQNEPFLQCLFSKKSGIWVDVFSSCAALEDIKYNIEELQEALDGPLLAAWLDYPNSMNSEDFCAIVFFAPDLMWSNTVVYNKRLLIGKWKHRQNGSQNS